MTLHRFSRVLTGLTLLVTSCSKPPASTQTADTAAPAPPSAPALTADAGQPLPTPVAPVVPAPDPPPVVPPAPVEPLSPAGGPTAPPPPNPLGIQLRLTDGKGAEGAVERLPVAPATPLEGADLQALLSRLPTFEAQPGDDVPFAFRERSLPAPRPGETVKTTFPGVPAEVTPAPVETGPLEVRRFSPEGDVPMAPQMSVTFSQPMVAVTSHEELAKEARPVALSPDLEGHWRWIGTKTLLFDPKVRLPMATEFKATVPAGTASANGGKLEKEVSWSFRTPPVRLLGHWPNEYQPTRLRPLIGLTFDQRVNADDVLPFVKVKYGMLGALAPIRVATEAEIASEPQVKGLASGEPGRWLVVALEKDLPEDTSITVHLAKGAPSAEGPRLTEADQTFSFRTYGPMRFKKAECGWDNRCPPLNPWMLEFTNPVDAESFDEKWVTVTPELPGLDVGVTGNSLMIRGASKGKTTYRIHVDKKIQDIFGQQIKNDVETSIKVTTAEPNLMTPSQRFTLLDPSGKPSISMHSINHKTVEVKLFKVQPKDYLAFNEYTRVVNNPKERGRPPGKLVYDKTVTISGDDDTMIETEIDLRPAFDDDLGNVMVWVRPTYQPSKYEYWEDVRVFWVQRSMMAVDAIMDGDTMYGVVSELGTGKPVSGVEVRLEPVGTKAVTGEDGIGALALPDSAATSQQLVAQRGTEQVFLPEGNYWGGSSNWVKRELGPQLRWFVFDDRGLYRPKETVHIKGWVRMISGGKLPMVTAVPSDVTKVTWTLWDSRNNEILKGESALTALGGFDGSFVLTDTMNLGGARIELRAEGSGISGSVASHSIQVQEFRRPEFEVTSAITDGPFLIGGNATATVSASYFAGGALPGADVTWNVVASQTSYTPPNRWDFAFGTWVPWWWDRGSQSGSVPMLEHKGQTDSAGTHNLEVAFESVQPPRPWTVTAEATVQDVNRQTFTTSVSMLVHPADRYVGIRGKRDVIQAGEPLEVDVVVTDIDGVATPDVAVEVRSVRMEWGYVKGDWKQEEKDEQTCSVTSKTEPVPCRFDLKGGGTYTVRARITDATGRPNESQRDFWVPGGKQPIERDVKEERVTLIPNQKEYKPGETAEILVQSPFSPADGFLTVRAGGIVDKQAIHIEDGSISVKVAIKAEYMPSVAVVVDLTGAAARARDDGEPDDRLPKRPAFASGSVGLSVPPLERTLTVEAVPAEAEIAPGGETTISVMVKDAAGAPVAGAEVAVVVVDESVLALTGYRIGDPIPVFYAGAGYLGQTAKLRPFLVLQDPMALITASANQAPGEPKMARMAVMKPSEEAAMPAPTAAAAPMGGMDDSDEREKESGGEAPPSGPIAVRKNFDPLAVFAAAVPTDAAGKATVPVVLPDNLTRYRITAVVVEGVSRYGVGESSLTARLPLMVRPSAPRFLNFGDTFELPVVLQNQTAAAMTVDVGVAALGMDLTAGQGRRVTIPARDRVEVRFPAAVTRVGIGRFQIGAQSGKWADAAKIELPIWTPATTEAFATYGVVDKGAIAQPVKAPGDVYIQFGGLEVTTASTNLQALTDAVLYLVQYPYECSEQISSRVLGIAALKDVLSAFEVEGMPSPTELLAVVERDMKRLELLQHPNGGFSFWKRNERDWPYLGVHVAHSLARAKSKGFAVPERMLERVHGYLKNIRSHFPHDYPESVKQSIEAYALYVRALLADPEPARARALIADMGGVKKAPMEGLGWLLNVLVGDAASAGTITEILRHLGNSVSETAGAAHFVTGYDDGNYLILHSDRRVDGILLEALIGADEKNDLIPKLVEGLLGHKTKGRWLNTQENVFVLLALDKYFNTYEKVTPNFVARVWLGKQYAGDHTFKGRTTERAQIDIPMAMVPPELTDLTIAKDGAGRLYYRVGMRYAPKNLKLEPADHGFYVERTYEAIDDAEDVKKDTDGVWHMKAGARVRVKLTMVAEGRRTHVALVDPLPAGLEPLNPDLLGSQKLEKPATPNEPGDDDGGDEYERPRGRHWGWWGPWYEHDNLRDERVEAFTSILYGGVYSYTYTARATTPGNFVAPPTKAEEMYMPETFGRSGSDRVIVE